MIFHIPKRDVDQPGDNLLAVSSHDMVLWVGYLSMISGIYFEIFYGLMMMVRRHHLVRFE